MPYSRLSSRRCRFPIPRSSDARAHHPQGDVPSPSSAIGMSIHTRCSFAIDDLSGRAGARRNKSRRISLASFASTRRIRTLKQCRDGRDRWWGEGASAVRITRENLFVCVIGISLVVVLCALANHVLSGMRIEHFECCRRPSVVSVFPLQHRRSFGIPMNSRPRHHRRPGPQVTRSKRLFGVSIVRDCRYDDG